MGSPNNGAAPNCRRPAGRRAVRGNVLATVAADRSFPAAVAWTLGVMARNYFAGPLFDL
jgi:hypothetical protein